MTAVRPPATPREHDAIESTHVPLPVTAAHRAEYAALRGAVAVLGLVGFGAAGAIGASLGRLGYWPLGIRRSVVERQIRAVMPELSEADVRRVARGAYEHLGRTSIEAALLPSRSATQIQDMIEDLQGWDLVDENVRAGRGQIIVTGHLGNWELAGAFVAARGAPVSVVARHMANPLFERYVSSTRERSGMHELHDDVAARRVPRTIRAGHIVAMLADQGAVSLSSAWVPFFGRLAKTPRGPAVFALRMNVPLLFAACVRRPSGRYALRFERVPVRDTGNRESDVEEILATYSGMLERCIRATPEQYLWHHRRWKHQQPGTPSALGDPLATTDTP